MMTIGHWRCNPTAQVPPLTDMTDAQWMDSIVVLGGFNHLLLYTECWAGRTLNIHRKLESAVRNWSKQLLWAHKWFFKELIPSVQCKLPIEQQIKWCGLTKCGHLKSQMWSAGKNLGPKTPKFRLFPHVVFITYMWSWKIWPWCLMMLWKRVF